MPLYEGIGLISEKHAVVLDIGSRYTKCGYSGELVPRCIIPSKQGDVWLSSCTDEDSLYAALVDFIHQLYFKWLLVNPKDRRVVVVENILGSHLAKSVLAKVLFKHYEVSSVLYLPSHLVSLLPLGLETGLVVDLGHSEASVLPVYAGVPVLKAWQALPLAGAAVLEAVRADLVARGRLRGEQAASPHIPHLLTDHVLTDIVTRCCFVTTMARGQQLVAAATQPEPAELEAMVAKSAPTVAYPCPSSQALLVDGVTREGAAELLWEGDEDGNSVASMVLDSIAASPLDCRRELAASLVLVGGLASMQGLRQRLGQELKRLLGTPKYSHLAVSSFKLHQPPAQPGYAVWLGAAIAGATDIVTTRSLPREQYLREGTVPDWSNLRCNSSGIEERQG